jgi:hypothetical protein
VFAAERYVDCATMTHLEALQRIAGTGGPLRSATNYDFEGDLRFTSHIVLDFDPGLLWPLLTLADLRYRR